ncbi:MAG: hypothetical protein OEV74_07080 [Cyclobacteriaceae bacterium]|nr:hypothetical protein [Cyclobacteriaceae bacterium]
MTIRALASLLLICSACQVGKIPCPRMKTVKLHKSFRPSATMLSAKASQTSEPAVQSSRESKPNDVRFIQNISMEEWDCPRPGEKHYMPKSVKQNIRKNWKKIESDAKKNSESDSLSDQ